MTDIFYIWSQINSCPEASRPHFLKIKFCEELNYNTDWILNFAVKLQLKLGHLHGGDSILKIENGNLWLGHDEPRDTDI